MKKIAIALCLSLAFAVPTAVLADETKTSSTTWTYNGYDCELWSENNAGTTSMTVNGDNGTGANAKGGTFTASWSNTKNILFRCGRKFSTTSGGNISGRDPAKPALDYGNISIDFAATWSSNDNVRMLGVYGWAFYAQSSLPTKDENGQNKSFDKAIEYYIIQDRGSYNAATGGDTKSTVKGEGTIDGIAYEYRVCDRIGRNSISGNSVNFKQYFSVPKNTSSHRTSGKISVSEHFKEWKRVGMLMDGPLYEVALKVESYSESGAKGTASVTKNLLTVGGTSTTSSNSTGGGTSSSSVGGSTTQSSSSAAKTQATTCKTPLITYPTSTVPSDPYTACFKYTNNKCYVCKVENEGDGNTCASSWVWSGGQIESNIEKGYWYYEVACPATSSSSAAVSSSSKPSSSSAAVSSSSKPSSSSMAASSSSVAASSSSQASSSSTAASSSSGVSSSSSSIDQSSSSVDQSSSSDVAEDSSSSGEDTEPILKNRIPVTHFSLQTQSDKTLRIEANAPTVVDIFDLRGNKVMSLNVSGSQTVKLSLPSGIYFAKVHGIKSVRFVLR
ncbi:MAG: T9SS type A sorting domain-containing protein [Fibromonadaceae bacterium]|jgi:hypothetical protein|nr:T9SS type A sorting domain-containing protein [Fibromonadaceae bacterium]